jgi:hypothetical protein
LKLDLSDQTDSRRNWQKRATEVESRIVGDIHSLALTTNSTNHI